MKIYRKNDIENAIENIMEFVEKYGLLGDYH